MTLNNSEIADNRGWLMRLFSNPTVGMIASAASVLGLVLTIYFYVQSTKKRDLVYFVNPAQAVVVKMGEASNLHVLYGDRELKSDVTATQIALWNQGNDSIRPENVLEQVTIRTNPSVPILEASVRKKSRSVVDLTLDQSRMNVGIVGLKWNILEQADGVVIQLVYAGPPSTEIQASGVIEGQHDIHQLKGRVNAETKYVNRKYDRLLNIFEGYGFIAVGIIMPFACYFSFRAKYPLSKWNAIIRTPDIVGVMFSFICIATGIYSLVFLPPNPPFGF